MKVLHIITGLNVGGAENMLCKLLENGNASDRSAAVLSLLDPGPLAERIRAIGVPIYTLGMKSGLAGPISTIRLARIVNIVSPDVLHGWMYHGNLAATFAHSTVARRLPLIWNVRHSLADPSLETRRTRAILKISAAISRAPSSIIYNSARAADQHEKYGYSPHRRVVIPNGFDFDIFRPNIQARKRMGGEFAIDPGATVVGIVARLHPMKAHAMLVKAVGHARAAGRDLHLVMIGEGISSPPAELAAAIADHLPADRVTLLGARSDIADILPGFDILAVPSGWGEGFPNVIGEALACEVPVVTTDVGDSALIVAENGIVVAPGDADSFAQALVELTDLGPEGRAAMGRAGRNRTRGLYGLAEIADRYERLYEAVSGDDGTPRRTLDVQEEPVRIR
ncbi:glycosyltransferase [Qipengyuania zhejiangensis]|uniref:glycosyltransferase n=1 Tax=Qipengyuania zhejiangensis TaxID=3077782 RepID=UPI002D78F364|nr:glycosyltransferase [Qipengyuania sp. Z2]